MPSSFYQRLYQGIDFYNIVVIEFLPNLFVLVLVGLDSLKRTQACCCPLSPSWLTQWLGEFDDVIMLSFVSTWCALSRVLGLPPKPQGLESLKVNLCIFLLWLWMPFSTTFLVIKAFT